MNRTFIEQLITKHEGTRLSVYADTKGNLTIGCGFNLDSGDAPHICAMFGINYVGIRNGEINLTQAQVYEIFEFQLNVVIGQAIQTFANFIIMPDTVQAVICDMIFEMGLPRFLGFADTIRDLKLGSYKQAAIDALNSLWAKEVPERAADDAALLEAA